ADDRRGPSARFRKSNCRSLRQTVIWALIGPAMCRGSNQDAPSRSGRPMKVELTSNWSAEKFAPYGAAVTAAMRKLAERVPREVTVEQLARDVVDGKRQLWLVLDDGDRFVAFVLTEVQVNDATGLKTLVIPSFAGEEGASTVPLIGAIEAWGK